jgi:hypothetical protein
MILRGKRYGTPLARPFCVLFIFTVVLALLRDRFLACKAGRHDIIELAGALGLAKPAFEPLRRRAQGRYWQS